MKENMDVNVQSKNKEKEKYVDNGVNTEELRY